MIATWHLLNTKHRYDQDLSDSSADAQLRGILDGNGMFMASRGHSSALPIALSATPKSEWGIMHRITRSFSADVDLAGSEARRPSEGVAVPAA